MDGVAANCEALLAHTKAQRSWCDCGLPPWTMRKLRLPEFQPGQAPPGPRSCVSSAETRWKAAVFSGMVAKKRYALFLQCRARPRKVTASEGSCRIRRRCVPERRRRAWGRRTLRRPHARSTRR
jgi:hypothetical protein